jgi:cell division transport system ATP-binding protein
VLDLIQFRNVSKIYDNGLRALQNVTFTIAGGEFVFVVGASGAGKSTIVKLLLKETNHTDGVLMVNNKDLSGIEVKSIPFYRRQFGVVFQDFRLLHDRTAYDNVAFAMEIIEASNKEIRRKVPAALAMVGLSERAHAYPQDMSGGEQQRVALARALVNNPTILLADEPTGNLDPFTSQEIIKVMNIVNRRGTTVIVATHDKDIVNTMQKRVISLNRGKVTRDLDRSGYINEA